MREELYRILKPVALLEKVLADNYNTDNTHEIDPGLRDEIEKYIKSIINGWGE